MKQIEFMEEQAVTSDAKRVRRELQRAHRVLNPKKITKTAVSCEMAQISKKDIYAYQSVTE